ncbi:carboxymuconolactone decarboxylase family protein [Amycolatopsis azurea]|uniref:Carboxymuconolactone decarboxylase n=1 Tax=Amycolatopsis azurea DSM 43854 TaxID=1238180 RepID=M2NJ38_9PSEU|nr:carboxymuconolactone decarboxylase family protein [Amycolatopsis azurea]EMD22149.1 Carboxymuconolactone decarboxylase [Amycolatopsis azurea DSM 43854]OOC06481.1 carboxymuconolactone decarboxylase [Amycolatopsis azurea DSM 43854]
MPHVALDENLPGIAALFAYRPETAAPLGQLADVLLRGPSSLSVGERELIGAVVSRGNDCTFCSRSHAAVAAEALEGGIAVVEAAWKDVDGAPVSAKVKALLHVALAVREGGKAVGEDLIAAARAEGATDVEIHDTVLIAAAFCMFNRYVDGLATIAPDDQDAYKATGVRLLAEGYSRI